MKKTNITNETRKAVYRRDGYQCAVCGDPRRLQIHHITHRSQGGGDEQMNLVTLCPICHAIAHNTKFPALPEEYGPDDVQQAIVEYMSDLYADLGFTWPDGQPIGGVGEWNQPFPRARKDCSGCGHEHNCRVQGCALLRNQGNEK